MSHVPVETIIKIVTEEVMKQLRAQGVSVSMDGKQIAGTDQNLINKTETIDFRKYKTPVLTEGHLQRLHELTGSIVIPAGTVITPKAREILKEKNILVQWQ